MAFIHDFYVFLHFFLKKKNIHNIRIFFLLIEKKLANNLKFFVEPSKDIKVFFLVFFLC